MKIRRVLMGTRSWDKVWKSETHFIFSYRGELYYSEDERDPPKLGRMKVDEFDLFIPIPGGAYLTQTRGAYSALRRLEFTDDGARTVAFKSFPLPGEGWMMFIRESRPLYGFWNVSAGCVTLALPGDENQSHMRCMECNTEGTDPVVDLESGLMTVILSDSLHPEIAKEMGLEGKGTHYFPGICHPKASTLTAIDMRPFYARMKFMGKDMRQYFGSLKMHLICKHGVVASMEIEGDIYLLWWNGKKFTGYAVIKKNFFYPDSQLASLGDHGFAFIRQDEQQISLVVARWENNRKKVFGLKDYTRGADPFDIVSFECFSQGGKLFIARDSSLMHFDMTDDDFNPDTDSVLEEVKDVG